MKPKRYTFKCWNCSRKYTLLREITEEQRLIVSCPFCGADGVVDLKPYRSEKIVARRGESEDTQIGGDYNLPEVLPTQKPE